jgi:hypothetical protein
MSYGFFKIWILYYIYHVEYWQWKISGNSFLVVCAILLKYIFSANCEINHALVTVIKIDQYLFQYMSFGLPLNLNKTWYKLWEIQQYINFRLFHFGCRSIYFYNESACIRLAVSNCQLVLHSEYSNEAVEGILQITQFSSNENNIFQ